MAISKPLNGSSSLSRRSSSRAAADIRTLRAPLAALLGLAFFLAFVQAPLLAQVDARMLQLPGRLGHADRLRIRRRHLDRAQGRRRRRPASPRQGRGIVPALFARRLARSPSAPTTTATSISTPSRRTGGLPARGHPPRHAGPHGRLVSRRQGAPVHLVAWTSGKQRFSQLYTRPREGGLPAKLPVPYGEFGALSPGRQEARLHADQPRTSGPGSATAAAWLPTSGSSTSRR